MSLILPAVSVFSASALNENTWISRHAAAGPRLATDPPGHGHEPPPQVLVAGMASSKVKSAKMEPRRGSRTPAQMQPASAVPAPSPVPADAAASAPVTSTVGTPPPATIEAPPTATVTAAPVVNTTLTGTAVASTTTTPAMAEYQCASQNSDNAQGDCPECTMSKTCSCDGWVKLGYGSNWSNWYETSGTVQCELGDLFTSDPYPGHSKICVCAHTLTASSFWDQPTHFHMWWPIGLVAIPASLVILLLTCVRWSNQIHKFNPGPVEMSLEAATPTVLYFAPMVCIVFVAAAKRAEEVFDHTSFLQEVGSPDLESTNHLVAERLIQFSAVGFVIQLCTRILMQDLTEPADWDGRTPSHKARFWINFYHVAVLVTGILLISLLIRIDSYMSASRPCIIVDHVVGLSVAYFACYYCYHICTFFLASHAYTRALAKLACLNMNFAPIMCALFLGIQVSADDNVQAGRSPEEHPSSQAEKWVMWTTYMVLIQTLLSLITPLIFRAELKETTHTGEEDLMLHRDFFLLLINILRWMSMIFIYTGVVVLSGELWGEDSTPPRSHVLTFLVALYFVIYGLMWATMTLRQLVDGDFRSCVRQLNVLKDLVAICPMVGAFFIGWWVVNE